MDLINALSIYFTCQGLADVECNTARGLIFEGIQCSSCGQAAAIAAPLEGSCDNAASEVQCIEAGASSGESNQDVTNEVEAGQELGKFADLADQVRDRVASEAIRRLLVEPEMVRPQFSTAEPPPREAAPVEEARSAAASAGSGAAAVVAAAFVLAAAAAA